MAIDFKTIPELDELTLGNIANDDMVVVHHGGTPYKCRYSTLAQKITDPIYPKILGRLSYRAGVFTKSGIVFTATKQGDGRYTMTLNTAISAPQFMIFGDATAGGFTGMYLSTNLAAQSPTTTTVNIYTGDDNSPNESSFCLAIFKMY
jgi:hypothetical protein